jgi:SHS2 domain-containing protein
MPPDNLFSPISLQDKYAGFLVEAPSMQRLFIQSGIALTQHLVTIAEFQEAEKKTLTVQAESPAALMNAWLAKIVELFETEHFGSQRIIFEVFDGTQIKAVLWGETYEAIKHGTKTGVSGTHCDDIVILDDVEAGFRAKVELRQAKPSAA